MQIKKKKNLKKKFIKWDTTLNINEFPDEVKSIFSKIYFVERYKFTSWIDKISNKFINNLDWWISPPASRNLYYSDLYRNICILKTINQLIKNKNQNKIKIIINNLELQKILKINFKSKNLDICLKYDKKFFKKYFYFLYLIKNILDFLVRFFLTKSLIKKNNQNNKKKIILVDTYVIDPEKKEKNYYGDLLKYSKKIKNNKILFVPSIIQSNISDFYKILLSLKNNKNYLFRESFLDIKDLLFCIFYFFRKNYFNGKYLKYENYDLSKLIYEEINYNRDLFSIFFALTNYAFIKKLKRNSLRVIKAINWFENQPKDKAWNYTFRKYFHNVTTVGYQGFLNYPEYMNIAPSNLEYKSKVIPQKIVVISKSYAASRKQFCKFLKIEYGPALRFEKLFYSYKRISKFFDVVLFLEGASKELDRSIILKLIKISKHLPKINFYLKAHPILPIEKLNIILPENFHILKYDLSYIALRTNISIAYGNTSALIESLAYGCKLIIPYDNLYDKHNFRKLNISNKLFKICPNDKILLENIKNFLFRSKIRTFNNLDIKNYLFNKVTKHNIKKLIS